MEPKNVQNIVYSPDENLAERELKYFTRVNSFEHTSPLSTALQITCL